MTIGCSYKAIGQSPSSRSWFLANTLKKWWGNHVHIWRKRIPGRENDRCKCPRGVCFVCVKGTANATGTEWVSRNVVGDEFVVGWETMARFWVGKSLNLRYIFKNDTPASRKQSGGGHVGKPARKLLEWSRFYKNFHLPPLKHSSCGN